MNFYLILILIISPFAFAADKDCVDGALNNLVSKKVKSSYAARWQHYRALQGELSIAQINLEKVKTAITSFIAKHPNFKAVEELERIQSQIRIKELRLQLSDDNNLRAELVSLKKEYESLQEEWRTFQTFGEYDQSVMNDFNDLLEQREHLIKEIDELSREATDIHRNLTE